MTEHFVKINTVFQKDEDRTVRFLAKKYCNKGLLMSFIEELFKDIFTVVKISGKKILLKPNWVRHSKKETDEICLRTHDSFLLATLEIILSLKPESVIIADAPIQGCYWDKMLNNNFIEQIYRISSEYDIPVFIKDLRRVTFDPSKNKILNNRNPYTDYLIFDLGKDSFLEPISSKSANVFRVTCYNPDSLAESHRPGIHKYCITRELFDADIVLSLPKVKTHQKTGITAAIKNLVGLNGDKDYLPHHRVGGTGNGGDCYPGRSFLRYWSELSIDNANRHQGKMAYKFWQKLSSFLWWLSFPENVHQIAAGWYGNDTTWRMVLDLNKIALYGTPDGKISSTPQREIYSLCDGIIGGQGDGPLNPEPLPLGIICFSNHSYLTDISMALLMGLDYRKIPLLSAAEKLSDLKKVNLTLNGKPIHLNELDKYAIMTLSPPGWVEYLNEEYK